MTGSGESAVSVCILDTIAAVLRESAVRLAEKMERNGRLVPGSFYSTIRGSKQLIMDLVILMLP